MKRISVYISEQQYERFQALAESYGQPYAELIREALNRYLRQELGSVTEEQKAGRRRVRHTRKRP
jgi:predicted DNA-binding protein